MRGGCSAGTRTATQYQSAVSWRADEHAAPPPPLPAAHRKAFEQLLRKLLRLPSRPAVMVLHHYSWWFAAATRPDGSQRGGVFWGGAEPQLSQFSHVSACGGQEWPHCPAASSLAWPAAGRCQAALLCTAHARARCNSHALPRLAIGLPPRIPARAASSPTAPPLYRYSTTMSPVCRCGGLHTTSCGGMLATSRSACWGVARSCGQLPRLPRVAERSARTSMGWRRLASLQKPVGPRL